MPEMIAEPIPYFSQLKFTPSSEQEQPRQDSASSKDNQTRITIEGATPTIHETDQSLVWSSGDQETNINRTKSNVQFPKRISSASTASSLSDYEQKLLLSNHERSM